MRKDPDLLVIIPRDWRPTKIATFYAITYRAVHPLTPLYGCRFKFILISPLWEPETEAEQEWVDDLKCRLEPEGELIFL